MAAPTRSAISPSTAGRAYTPRGRDARATGDAAGAEAGAGGGAGAGEAWPDACPPIVPSPGTLPCDREPRPSSTPLSISSLISASAIVRFATAVGAGAAATGFASDLSSDRAAFAATCLTTACGRRSGIRARAESVALPSSKSSVSSLSGRARCNADSSVSVGRLRPAPASGRAGADATVVLLALTLATVASPLRAGIAIAATATSSAEATSTGFSASPKSDR